MKPKFTASIKPYSWNCSNPASPRILLKGPRPQAIFSYIPPERKPISGASLKGTKLRTKIILSIIPCYIKSKA
jgi:hypothetical protein